MRKAIICSHTGRTRAMVELAEAWGGFLSLPNGHGRDPEGVVEGQVGIGRTSARSGIVTTSSTIK